MGPVTKLLSLTATAALFGALTAPAFAANNPNSLPHYCIRNVVGNNQPGSGTNAGTLGINTNVSSNEPNFSGPPVQPNTPENTNASNINSNNPGVHAKRDACTAMHRSNRYHRKKSGAGH
jgi:hypothetical protein